MGEQRPRLRATQLERPVASGYLDGTEQPYVQPPVSHAADSVSTA